MALDKKQRLSGRIVLVQEDRFRMVSRTGKGYLFTLSRKARSCEEDLQRWHEANVRVVVTFEGEPNLASGIAHRVEPRSDVA